MTLMVENSEIRNWGNFIMQKDLLFKSDREIKLATLDAKNRLIEFRKTFSNLENEIPHSNIASYLGMTTVSLSRLRANI